jgi:hypothetical protein
MSSREEFVEHIKKEIIDYLLKHHNIEFLDDDLERHIYWVLLDLFEKLIPA